MFFSIVLENFYVLFFGIYNKFVKFLKNLANISVRPGLLSLAEYFLLWLSPRRLPCLTVLFLAAHRPQNASYKVRYQLP